MMDDAAAVVNSFYHTFFGISSGERAFGGRGAAHVVPQFSHLNLGSEAVVAASRLRRWPRIFFSTTREERTKRM
jgi:hypothetical protein